MSWPRRRISRAGVVARRRATVMLREAGHTWAWIAAYLGHRSAQHAYLDWTRAKQ